MSSNKKFLAKRAERREKAKRAKRERKLANRPMSTADFSKKFIADILALYTKKEQFKRDIDKNITIIKTLKTNDPDKYGNISLDSLEKIKSDFEIIDKATESLSMTAAKLEDAKDNESSMRLILDTMGDLTSAQSNITELMYRYLDVVSSTGNQIRGYAPTETSVVKDDAVTYEEERTHEDQEIDVTPEDIHASEIVNEK